MSDKARYWCENKHLNQKLSMTTLVEPSTETAFAIHKDLHRVLPLFQELSPGVHTQEDLE